jgi:4'-phosphopantetheinyl transferase
MNLSIAAHPTHSLFDHKPLALSMPVGEIHVWQVLAADVVPFHVELWNTLDGEEKQKISKIQFEADRIRSIASRGVLRTLLGWYLEVQPASIKFSYGTLGKPALAVPHGLNFNVSHAEDLLLYTFAFGHAIGTDVERVSSLPDLLALARSMFSAREQRLLASLPDQEKRREFFRLWTLREAFGKMRGDGLTDELRNADILTILNDKERWTVKTFAPLPGYEAAVVVEGVVHRYIRFNGFSELFH